MKRLALIILSCCFTFNLISQDIDEYQGVKRMRSFAIGDVGLSIKNVCNGFNSPLIYSGPGLGVGFEYLDTDYDKSMLYAGINVGAAILSPLPAISDSSAFVGMFNADVRFSYHSVVYRNGDGFSVYVGGVAITEAQVRNNSVMSNSATDVNAAISLSPSAGLTYKRERLAIRWLVDIPVISVLLVPPYTGGLPINEDLDIYLASLGSYQRFTSDFSFTLFMKNGNGFKFGYKYNYLNVNRKERLTMGGNMVSAGFVFNLSKPSR